MAKCCALESIPLRCGVESATNFSSRILETELERGGLTLCELMEDYDTRRNPRCECREGIIVAPGIVKIEFVHPHQPMKQQPFPDESPLVVYRATDGHILLSRVAEQSPHSP